MRALNLSTAADLIDFAAAKPELVSLGNQQLEGAVALHNRLARRGVAYLADEVGMGKTYIALGVVALMRRFNPSLRVLYLLPKVNVRDKWEKDYRSFVEYNYRSCDLVFKGLDKLPAAPYEVCEGLRDLVQAVATGSARDYFICTSAFSFGLGNDIQSLRNSLAEFDREMLQFAGASERLRAKLTDGMSESEMISLKDEIKRLWASSLHAILPRFDLVVVDEAHNLRNGRDTSYRNQLLAMTLLGEEGAKHSRVRRLLLLSATPFDRQIVHLRNQLSLFGFETQASLPDISDLNDDQLVKALSELIVRRPNVLCLNGKLHTRNMYRNEHRSGTEVEVQMGMEEQLFAALLQKKVNEYLQENCSGKFELGMLASFESYLPGEKNKAIQFDGEDESGHTDSRRDASDRHVVESLVDDYWCHFGNQMPPHPKMDWVTKKLHSESVERGKKQLVFVRRVRSVSELKLKLDSLYNNWLGRYIRGDKTVRYWFEQYELLPRNRNVSILGEAEIPEEESVASSDDNFFTWFYRGENTTLNNISPRTPYALRILPSSFKKVLSQNSSMFEPNWRLLDGMPWPLEVDWGCMVERNNRKPTAQNRFRNAQYAYLKTVSDRSPQTPEGKVASRLLLIVFRDFQPGLDLADPSGLARDLEQRTLWNTLGTHLEEKLHCLSPGWGETVFNDLAAADTLKAERTLMRHMIHMELLAVICRLDHPFIDLYSLRDSRAINDEASADDGLIDAFCDLLARQASSGQAFCSFQILRDIVENLDLLIKLNFPDSYYKKVDGLTRYLASQLNPMEPVSGATGENSGNRSPLARKFRMPGYPRVLVSTDVFQEGEDLHTFCDSVVHYGISASPIALEQKVGRVDRVNSLAQRSMLADQLNSRDHFIQVSFPHIKESLEFLQVRQAAENLNTFLLGLHDLDKKAPTNLTVDTNDQLLDHSGIAPQIKEFMKSKFKIEATDLHGEDKRSLLEERQQALTERLDHVRKEAEDALMKLCDPQDGRMHFVERIEGWLWEPKMKEANHPVEVCLRNAQTHGELLFAATMRDGRDFSYEQMEPYAEVAYLKELQKDPLIRIQLWDGGKDGWTLRRNAEVYTGAPGVLVGDEIRDAYLRVKDPILTNYTGPAHDSESRIHELIDTLCRGVSHRDEDRVEIIRLDDRGIRFSFHLEGRVQDLRWRLSSSHLVLTSRVLDRERTLELARHERGGQNSLLIKHTLVRNQQFDMVDFHVDELGGLSVRACHPVGHLNKEELAFMAHSVASEADRLKQILQGMEVKGALLGSSTRV